MQCLIWLSVAIIKAFVCADFKDVSSKNVSDYQRLVNMIFENYDKAMRPVWNTADVTNVTLDPALYSILGTDEAAESITIVQWLRIEWTDVFLRWNPADFGGMQEFLIPISQIWIDIAQPIPDKKNYVRIDYDGKVAVSIAQVLILRCNYDIIMFPFDVQNCTMRLDSWMYTVKQMDIYSKTKTADIFYYNKNEEWDLISMMARRRLGSKFVHVFYDIIIQRNPAYYLLTFVLPGFIITTISLIGIFAPFNDSGGREEKVTMGLTTLLTMTVIVTLIAQQIPKSSEGMPLLGIYIMLQIGIAAFSSLMAVIVMYQHRKWINGHPIPAWILTVTRLTHKEANFSAHKAKIAIISALCNKLDEISNPANGAATNIARQQHSILKHIQSMVGQMLMHIYEQSDEKNLRKDWQRACDSLDILLMIGFLVLNCVLTGAFLVVGYSHLKI